MNLSNTSMLPRAAQPAPLPGSAKLYTNGTTTRLLPRPLPGWHRVGAVRVKEAA